tara:strand:+ start:2793 stop:3605 length:813 start_codon:yes stop_codon:yes gene_type:complete
MTLPLVTQAINFENIFDFHEIDYNMFGSMESIYFIKDDQIFKYFNILEKFILTSTKELLHISKNKVITIGLHLKNFKLHKNSNIRNKVSNIKNLIDNKIHYYDTLYEFEEEYIISFLGKKKFYWDKTDKKYIFLAKPWLERSSIYNKEVLLFTEVNSINKFRSKLRFLYQLYEFFYKELIIKCDYYKKILLKIDLILFNCNDSLYVRGFDVLKNNYLNNYNLLECEIESVRLKLIHVFCYKNIYFEIHNLKIKCYQHMLKTEIPINSCIV